MSNVRYYFVPELLEDEEGLEEELLDELLLVLLVDELELDELLLDDEDDDTVAGKYIALSNNCRTK